MNKAQALHEALRAQETLSRCMRILDENMVMGEVVECPRGKAESVEQIKNIYTQEVANMNKSVTARRNYEKANGLVTVVKSSRVKLTSK